MKFSCNTTELLTALQLVSRAISGQQALPILANILFHAEGKRCTVSATDLELSIVTSFEAHIENEGSITVPAKAILNFAQYNTDPEVVLETTEGTQLKCTSKHSKTLIAGESASEYPTIVPVEKKTAFNLDATSLLSALHLVTFASAKTSLRPVLSGVFLRSEKGKLILVATDSYRLSECSIPTSMGEEEISCIIPVKVLDELKMILGSKKGASKADEVEGEEEKDKKEKKEVVVEVILSTQQIELHVGSTKLLSRLIEGKFPNYQQILPKTHKSRVMLPIKELTTVSKRMHYFVKEMNNTLAFHVSSGQVQIATPATQLGKDEATLVVEVEGEGGKIALSSSYLLDFLAHIDGEHVEFSLVDSLHPAVFHLPTHPQFLHLIMPLRMQEE